MAALQGGTRKVRYGFAGRFIRRIKMCIGRFIGKKKSEAIAQLPETFKVWKYCPRDGVPQYRTTGRVICGRVVEYKSPPEPALKAKRWHKARFFPFHRSSLIYKPGFHAFTDHKKAKRRYPGSSSLREFEARREDVTEIGRFDSNYGRLKGIVLSHIKPI